MFVRYFSEAFSCDFFFHSEIDKSSHEYSPSEEHRRVMMIFKAGERSRENERIKIIHGATLTLKVLSRLVGMVQ
jgi:hypothetical protein